MIVTEFRVAGTTNVDRLAGAIAHALRRGDGIDLVTYGLRQVGIAAQAVALTREFLFDDGVGLSVEIQQTQIKFQPVEIKSGVRISLRPAALHGEALAERAAQA